MTALPRIYFDTNSGTPAPRSRYGLWFDLSKRDLAAIAGGPRDGMRVIIYMTNELEMEAILEFDSEWNEWVGDPLLETIKYY